jgi:hypothetical protein
VPHIMQVISTHGYKYTITAPGRDWCGGGAVAVWAQVSDHL